MGADLTLLLDIECVLDVLAERRPHYDDAAQLWAAVEKGSVHGLLAASSVIALHILAEQHLKQHTGTVVMKLLQVFDIAPVTRDVILSALALGWPDFENAVQAAAAMAARADYLVSRNTKAFKGSPVPVLQPAEALALVRGSEVVEAAV